MNRAILGIIERHSALISLALVALVVVLVSMLAGPTPILMPR